MRRALAAIVAWLAFIAVCALIAARAHYTADMSAFLPRTPSASQQILVDQLREGVVSHDVADQARMLRRRCGEQQGKGGRGQATF